MSACKPPQEQPQSLYTQGNPYGYRLNLRHPLVRHGADGVLQALRAGKPLGKRRKRRDFGEKEGAKP